MRRKLITLLAGLGLAAFAPMAKATPTVTLYLTTINATATSGTWQVYADVSHDNDGLANFNIDVLATGNASIVNAAPTIKAPRPQDHTTDNGDGTFTPQYADGNSNTMGFNSNVTGGSQSGVNRSNITGGQSTAYAANDDPTFDMGILVGVGQEAANASPQNGSTGPAGSTNVVVSATAPWGYTPTTLVAGGTGAGGAGITHYTIAGTLIEQGTYLTTGQTGFLQVTAHSIGGDGFVEVLGTDNPLLGQTVNGFNEAWGLDSQQGDTPIATVLPGVVNAGGLINLAVPEPTTLGLLGVGMGLMATGRKFRRKTA